MIFHTTIKINFANLLILTVLLQRWLGVYEKFVGSTTFSWDYLVLRRVIQVKKTKVLEIRDPNERKRKSASVGG